MTTILALILSAVSVLTTPPQTETSAVSEVRGILAQADESHPANYLAIPEGPGIHVTVCGAGGCVSLVSTDAGPAKFLQRAGRIGDLAVGLWMQVTGLPRSAGLAIASIRYGPETGPSPTPPSTNTAP